MGNGYSITMILFMYMKCDFDMARYFEDSVPIYF